MSNKQDLKPILRELNRRGYRVEKSPRNSHWRVYAPGGIVFFSSSPSDWRAVRNIRADLKRYGIDLSEAE